MQSGTNPYVLLVSCVVCLAVGAFGGAWYSGRSLDFMAYGPVGAEMLMEMERLAYYHAGKAADAGQTWDEALDTRIINVHDALQVRPGLAEKFPELVAALKVAKAYREQYPSTGMQKEQVEAVLADVEPLTAEDSIANNRGRSPLGRLIREAAGVETSQAATSN